MRSGRKVDDGQRVGRKTRRRLPRSDDARGDRRSCTSKKSMRIRKAGLETRRRSPSLAQNSATSAGIERKAEGRMARLERKSVTIGASVGHCKVCSANRRSRKSRTISAGRDNVRNSWTYVSIQASFLLTRSTSVMSVSLVDGIFEARAPNRNIHFVLALRMQSVRCDHGPGEVYRHGEFGAPDRSAPNAG